MLAVSRSIERSTKSFQDGSLLDIIMIVFMSKTALIAALGIPTVLNTQTTNIIIYGRRLSGLCQFGVVI